MKTPKFFSITEQKATRILFDYILDKEIKYFSYQEIKNKICKKYIKKYGLENNPLHIKYANYIFRHAIKMLKKEDFISQKYKDDWISIIPEPEPFENVSNEKVDWKTENTISNVYEFVGDRKHLMPSFQRTTAWKKPMDYIELAYSIYKNNPLGIMYFWKITKEKASEIIHYNFKRDIISNEEFGYTQFNKNEFLGKNIFSVVDGQQRLTAINVIINGSFNGKKLYFNERKQDNKIFAFKEDKEYFCWNKLEDIYNDLKQIFTQYDSKNNSDIMSEAFNKISRKRYISVSSLERLYYGLFKAHLLAICEIQNADLPQVLEIFERSNKFGKKLSPADIVLSRITGDEQKINIRKQIEIVLKTMRKYKSSFSFASIIKLISVYFTEDPTMNHITFARKNKRINAKYDVTKESSWKKLVNIIKKVNDFLKENNFSPEWINSDNSLIPIIYWWSRYNEFLIIRDDAIKSNILNYLLFAQLLKQFKSSTDAKLKEIIKNLNKDFNNWKLGTSDKKTNISEVLSQLDKLKYKTDDHKIKIILSLNNKNLAHANTIEHIYSQKNNGIDKIWNLALLPLSDNSSIKALAPKEKIEKLSHEYNKSSNEILEAFIMKQSDLQLSEIEFYENRKIRIRNLIQNNLANK